MSKHKLQSGELDNMLRSLLVAHRELVGRGQPTTWVGLVRLAREYSAALGRRDADFDAIADKTLRDLFDNAG